MQAVQSHAAGSDRISKYHSKKEGTHANGHALPAVEQETDATAVVHIGVSKNRPGRRHVLRTAPASRRAQRSRWRWACPRRPRAAEEQLPRWHARPCPTSPLPLRPHQQGGGEGKSDEDDAFYTPLGHGVDAITGHLFDHALEHELHLGEPSPSGAAAKEPGDHSDARWRRGRLLPPCEPEGQASPRAAPRVAPAWATARRLAQESREAETVRAAHRAPQPAWALPSTAHQAAAEPAWAQFRPAGRR